MRLDHLVLEREDVGILAIVALGPDMAAGLAVYQLRIDPYVVAGAAHGALQHVAHTELARDLADVDRLILVGERRVRGR